MGKMSAGNIAGNQMKNAALGAWDRIRRGEYNLLLLVIYAYLALPVVLFMLAWCKWFIGIPVTAVICISLLACLREHGKWQVSLPLGRTDIKKYLAILVIVLCWVALSGIGGYVWQNSDHSCRNTIFDMLMTRGWPVYDTVDIDGVLTERGLVYYIGFWLPAAAIGKKFGVSAGYAALYLWAVLGVLLVYALICVWRKKIELWPLVLMICFSGADIVGAFLATDDVWRLFGSEHLEWWAGIYQFSSMTTQLFWVFNQSLPAWIACALIFLHEKPRNLVFVWALILLPSTMSFAGLVPYMVYFLVRRCRWGHYETVPQLLFAAWKNWGSVQNVLGGGCVGVCIFLYLKGNVSAGMISASSGTLFPVLAKLFTLPKPLLAAGGCALVVLVLWGVAALWLRGRRRLLKKAGAVLLAVVLYIIVFRFLLNNNVWDAPVYRMVMLLLFFLVEVGGYFYCLKKKVQNRALYRLTFVWLLIIPLIAVGSGADFCMRASIPGLFLLMLWCMEVLAQRGKDIMTRALIVLLLIGSITPFHEIKRTLVYTKAEYTLERVAAEDILRGNNFSGGTDTWFWKWMAQKK